MTELPPIFVTDLNQRIPGFVIFLNCLVWGEAVRRASRPERIVNVLERLDFFDRFFGRDEPFDVQICGPEAAFWTIRKTRCRPMPATRACVKFWLTMSVSPLLTRGLVQLPLDQSRGDIMAHAPRAWGWRVVGVAVSTNRSPRWGWRGR